MFSISGSVSLSSQDDRMHSEEPEEDDFATHVSNGPVAADQSREMEMLDVAGADTTNVSSTLEDEPLLAVDDDDKPKHEGKLSELYSSVEVSGSWMGIEPAVRYTAKNSTSCRDSEGRAPCGYTAPRMCLCRKRLWTNPESL